MGGGRYLPGKEWDYSTAGRSPQHGPSSICDNNTRAGSSCSQKTCGMLVLETQIDLLVNLKPKRKIGTLTSSGPI